MKKITIILILLLTIITELTTAQDTTLLTLWDKMTITSYINGVKQEDTEYNQVPTGIRAITINDYKVIFYKVNKIESYPIITMHITDFKNYGKLLIIKGRDYSTKTSYKFKLTKEENYSVINLTEYADSYIEIETVFIVTNGYSSPENNIAHMLKDVTFLLQ